MYCIPIMILLQIAYPFFPKFLCGKKYIRCIFIVSIVSLVSVHGCHYRKVARILFKKQNHSLNKTAWSADIFIWGHVPKYPKQLAHLGTSTINQITYITSDKSVKRDIYEFFPDLELRIQLTLLLHEKVHAKSPENYHKTNIFERKQKKLMSPNSLFGDIQKNKMGINVPPNKHNRMCSQATKYRVCLTEIFFYISVQNLSFLRQFCYIFICTVCVFSEMFVLGLVGAFDQCCEARFYLINIKNF
eukprot:TRINITY_DN35060_c0_g2_i1.p1 TRINITY_DN35060_c0_g2~~TRINITY_DN35060_c0_g2_i1.p1  ORF type:complete len:245 (+),score=-10.78 TRINITY_DN35060_c0_g2_i1:252-986(+)